MKRFSIVLGFMTICSTTFAAPEATKSLPKSCQFQIAETKRVTKPESAFGAIHRSTAFNNAKQKCVEEGFADAVFVAGVMIPFIGFSVDVECRKVVAVDTETLKLEACPKISDCTHDLFLDGKLNPETQQYLAGLKTRYQCE